MCSGREKGRSVMRRGFWGDVANGPWAATMGVDCADERLTKKRGEQHTKSSCDIAYYNVLSWLACLETNSPFTLKQEDLADFEYGGSVAGGGLAKGFLSGGKGGGAALAAVAEEEGGGAAGGGAAVSGAAASGAADGEGAIVDITEEVAASKAQAEAAAATAAADAKRAAEARAKVVAAKMAKLPPFKVKFLCGEWVDTQRKPRHQRAFDVVAIATHMAYVMGSEALNGLLRPRAALLLETARYVIECHNKDRRKYGAQLCGVARRLGWQYSGELGGQEGAGQAGGGGQEGGALAPDGIAESFFRFGYDESAAPALAAAAKAAMSAAEQQSGGAVPELTMKNGADAADADAADASDASASDAAAGGAAAMDCLRIAEAEPATADATGASASAQQGGGGGGTPAAAAAPVRTVGGSEAALSVSSTAAGGKVCAITGRPARYRDPVSGLPYADLAAFKELRVRYPAPAKPEAEPAAAAATAEMGTAAAAGEAGGGEDGATDDAMEYIAPANTELRPILVGSNFARRVNKVA